MFDDSKITIKNPIRKIKECHPAEEAYIYKIKAPSKKPYMIRVEKYKYNIFFLKFYPKRLELSPYKYKFRNSKCDATTDLPRLVAACIVVAKKIQKGNTDAIFGFYGQWDDIDIERKSKISQRYSIYRVVLASKVRESEYKHVYDINFNSHLIIPIGIYNEKLQEDIAIYFNDIFGAELQNLAVPHPDSDN